MAGVFAYNDAVAIEHGEGLNFPQMPWLSVRRAPALWFRPPQKVDVGQIADGAHIAEQTVLPPAMSFSSSFWRAVEVILDGFLAPARDDEDVLDSSQSSFLNNILNNRLVHEGQHSLGTALVAGSTRVPSPAAGMTALVIGIGLLPPVAARPLRQGALGLAYRESHYTRHVTRIETKGDKQGHDWLA